MVEVLTQAAVQAVADPVPGRTLAQIGLDIVVARIPAILASLEGYGWQVLQDLSQYRSVILAGADPKTVPPLLGRLSGWLRVAA